MKTKKFNFLLYVHAALVLYAVLFAGYVLLDNTLARWLFLKIPYLLMIGNISLLFGGVPFSIVTLVMRTKNKFDRKYSIPVLVLSIINILISIAAWTVAILFVLTKP